MTALAGTPRLLRLGLRRDRAMIPAWVLVLAVFVLSTMSSYQKLYDTQAERDTFTAKINDNAATLALYGRVHDATVGGLTAWRMGTLGAALVGVMTLLLVIRHTRAEEETGRLELVGSGAIGRRAPLTAALLVAALASVLLGALVALGLAGQGGTGALAFGLAWAGGGLLFAAVAAVAAQVTENARTARGIAVAVLALSFLVRAAGDASGAHWLTWLSPIGWLEEVRPFGGDRFWVLLLPLGLTAVLCALAYALVERRDLGAGLLAARLGPASAAPRLRSPLALAWRLQRGSLLGWAAGFLVYGLAIGGIANGVDDLVGDSADTSELITKMGGQSGLADAFLAASFGLMGGMASMYGVQAALRPRSEETSQRAEPLLATATGRLRWAAGHLLIALAGTALMLLIAGAATGITYGAAAGDVGGRLAEALGGVLVQVPAAWVLTGIAIALFGLLPRASQGAWAMVGAFLLLGQLGPVLNLSRPVMDLSPFTHTPKLPGGTMTATPLIVLLAVAAALVAAGLAGLRRRDIAS
ncbi:ABC transporter permease [Actinomadura rubrisoli]|uniref:ABC transporter permease n=1 Tax=Actinomadura rubrisoli TaxID=2530368 RepID=A0A4R5BVB4_9ACTN|nr:ABC transporter permease [Actinomadura rubrisoli]TDD90115.1 ABC transporter permease [Actinomadura rubrisoli]